jgi:hypothetical protein
MSTVAQRSDHVTMVRMEATRVLNALDGLNALRREWDALGFSSGITSADMTGANEGITPAQVASVYTTLDAFNSLMAAGHATNLYGVSQ